MMTSISVGPDPMNPEPNDVSPDNNEFRMFPTIQAIRSLLYIEDHTGIGTTQTTLSVHVKP